MNHPSRIIILALATLALVACESPPGTKPSVPHEDAARILPLQEGKPGNPQAPSENAQSATPSTEERDRASVDKAIIMQDAAKDQVKSSANAMPMTADRKSVV